MVQKGTILADPRFEHRWLSTEFIAESRALGENERTREQHYVPQLYLKRWMVGGVVQPVLVDRRTPLRPQPPKDIAKKTNFYSLPAPDSTMGAPLRWIETHLSRIENDCAHRLDQLERGGTGIVADDGLKRDLAVFLGLQAVRIPSNRERHLLLIEGPVRAKREFYRHLVPAMTDAEFHGLLARAHPDPKVEALYLMFSDVELATAGALYRRQWAVFRTTGPIVTCDDPVVLVAGPPHDRGAMHGVGRSAVVFYPLNPQHLLVMFRPDLPYRGDYQLDEQETRSVNHEIMAAANTTVFEKPGDDITVQLEVPTRTRPELDDEQIAQLDDAAALQLMLRAVSPRSRWDEVRDAPGWPVPRWYRP